MTNKKYFIFQDVKSKEYFISPNKFFLSLMINHFSRNKSKAYITQNINEVGYFSKNLSPVFYDDSDFRLFIGNFLADFKDSAINLRKDFNYGYNSLRKDLR